MSSIVWDKDNLIQKVGGNVEELGHVKYDQHSNEYVLWIKDARDVFGTNKGYIRGDSFPSMKDAKQNAAGSKSAFLSHYMWMVGLRDDRNKTGKDVTQGIEDSERSKPLTVSTFKEEMDKLTAQLDRAKKEASKQASKKIRKARDLFFPRRTWHRIGRNFCMISVHVQRYC